MTELMSRFIGSSPARKRAAEVLCAVVLAVYLVFLFVGCVQTGTFFIGEAASYSLTTVSLAHDGNGFVSGEELALAREWFPDWASNYQSFAGSGYVLANGDVVPWYFPTYSACCVPALWILQLLKLPLNGTFCYTNFVLFALVLILVFTDRARLRLAQRVLMTLLLGINPILFYFEWASAETFLFAFVALACWCWVTNRRHRAALGRRTADVLRQDGRSNPHADQCGRTLAPFQLGTRSGILFGRSPRFGHVPRYRRGRRRGARPFRRPRPLPAARHDSG